MFRVEKPINGQVDLTWDERYLYGALIGPSDQSLPPPATVVPRLSRPALGGHVLQSSTASDRRIQTLSVSLCTHILIGKRKTY